MDHPLRTVVYTIGKVVGTRSSHLTTREHMLYAIECMEPIVLNWCEGMLVSLKDQLNKRKRGYLKQFGYGAMIVSFILQRVPHMRPQVDVSRLGHEDSRMLRWVYVMARHGGGGSKVVYGSTFFHWLAGQLLMIEDYAYEGAGFREDLELPLSEGEEWDERGKKDTIHHVFNFSILFCNAETSESGL